MKHSTQFLMGAALVAVLMGIVPARAQMVSGPAMAGWTDTFGLRGGTQAADLSVQITACSAPGSVVWPGETPHWTVQIMNNTDRDIALAGRVDVVAYGTRGVSGDVWTPHVFKISDAGTVTLAGTVPAHGFRNVDAAPVLPARFGGYALVADLGPLYGRRFLTSCTRAFRPAAPGKMVQYPSFCLDDLPRDVLTRLDVHAIRYGVEYKPTTDPDWPAWYAAQGEKLRAYRKAGVSVLLMQGGGAFTGPTQPLGRPRPWLDKDGRMQDTKFDLAWLPSYDADFEEFTHRFARDYGWPHGPVTAFSLWNEPWEGISISGWGADVLRYRELWAAQCRGVDRARAEGADVLTGGTDSTSNALDKFFSDGTDALLPHLDFVSVHYQGLSPLSNYKQWRSRTGPRGRVRIWDTESWVANTDDRVAATVAADRAAGYDRAMGIYGGNVCESRTVQARDASGSHPADYVDTYPVAAAVGASQHLIGERKFRRLLFRGLPWVMQFDGLNGKPDDGTLVVVGDLGEEFGAYHLPYRTARGFAEARHKDALRAQLDALPAATRAALQKQLDTPETLRGATLSLPASPDYALLDFYGNVVPAQSGKVVVPLDGRGFFLRAGVRPGAFARLVQAVQESRITGIEPVAIVAHDLTTPLGTRPSMLRLSLTNVLNRPVAGRLRVTLGRLTVGGNGQTLALRPHETRTVSLPVSGTPAVSNAYPLRAVLDAGRDGPAALTETLHVNVISRRTVTVDGNLEDWQGALPQSVRGGPSAPSLTEAAWFPFKTFPAGTAGGFATGYVAADDTYFYFAAKVSDPTPDSGTVRFAAHDDDAYFYPAVSYAAPAAPGQNWSAHWTGWVQVPATGDYTFTTTSDDGVRLWVDGKQIVNNWTPHAAADDSGTLHLEAGRRVPVRLEYYQGTGSAALHLLWQGPGVPRDIVPASALFPSETGGEHGLRGRYFVGTDLSGEQVAERTDPQIDFGWQDGQWPVPEFAGGGANAPGLPLAWPAGVRRYSYRTDPELPSGNSPWHDNVQIAFNVLPVAQKATLPALPGIMPGFISAYDTDYEFALNTVAPIFGGGTEIWKLQTPGMPRKHFYPRQPPSPQDGPVLGGRLVTRRDGGTRLTECAIPWAAMPEVKRRLDAGQTVKFSFRVNDNGDAQSGGFGMELGERRSVARQNASFHVDWMEHWANELEFGMEPKR